MTSAPRLTWEAAVLQLRGQPGASALVEACFYDDPVSKAARRYRESSEWAAVRRLLPQVRGRALDVGAGRGISSYALAQEGYAVTALEPDPSNVVGAGAIRELVRETGTAIEIAETWGEDLPFPSATFDVVHCRQVLHHAKDLERLCSQIGRVLKPGGAFFATREHVLTHKGDLPVFLQGHPLHSLYGGENAYLLDEYLGAIVAAGIRIERVLNPMQSDINLFPETVESTKRRWAKKLGLPTALLPDMLLRVAGSLSNTPGRLYSFVGRKPVDI